MPLTCEALPTRSREEFCVALKAARERRGISLAKIADATKIPASLFAALERNDLRCWPTGLYRRSFFRDYVRALGLPEADVCDEFVRLFGGDDGARSGSAAVEDTQATTDLRLALDTAWHEPRGSLASRLATALIDVALVITAAGAIAWAAHLDRSTTAALVTVAYFSLATTVLGASPAKWMLSRHQSVFETLSRGAGIVSATFARHKDDGAVTAAPEPEPAPWVSDARRVGPSPQLRFRIKESS
jgi:transcriptional regulator with XRE-family HTH domain